MLNTYYMNVLLPQTYFRKMDMTLMFANKLRDIWLNNDIINSIVKLIVHGPVDKLIYIIYIY